MRDPTRPMAFGLDRGVEIRDHDSHAAEAEALLNESWLSEDDTRRSSLNENDAPQLALASLQDSSDLDNAHLRAQGHEAALQRSFSPLAALGLGFSITNSWVGYLSNFGQNLIYGGPQSVVFGLLVATTVQWTITLGLSEVASTFPSAGGQYHFTYILAPTKHKKFAAFVIGWMTLLGWWVITCSGVSLCAVSVAGMINFWHPSWEAARWQIYLIYLVTIFITAGPLFLSPKSVPKITQATLFLSVSGFVIVFILLLALKKQTRPASFITESGLGTSGWSDGTAWMIGIGNALYAYGGTDGAIHIAEEIPRPGKNIPLAMNLTMCIGFLTAFPMTLALMFGMTDIDAVLNSKLASAEIFYQITQSKGIVTFMQCWVIVVYFMSLTSQWVTAGRMTWAFARDRGIPYSEFFSHVSTSLDFPVRATILSICFCCIYGLLYLASTTAFNSIVTSAVLYLSITYAVPQGIIVSRGRATSLPARAFNLGNLGYICNILSPLLVAVIGTFICFPPELPVTTSNMNYTPVILFGLFIVIMGLWYTRGKKFVGPRIDWELLNLTACK
ncbi:hypothetical protein N7G274_006784 [Stereocaulon virgatum]|uniref:Choline transporter n=1 Tax=Stereocaulon virgatum TaxID=373712 RepID=A0ABR4A606_9LECA